MVNDVDINISCTMSRYFWRNIANKNKGIDLNGEFKCEILFFEALPDNFYDLICESSCDSGNKSQGQVLSNLAEISGCKPLIIDGSLVSKECYCYPIFRSEAGEDGFYMVIYDRDNDVVINDGTAYTDIATLCKNIIISLDDEEEHTIRGFLIKTKDESDSNYTDYLLAYWYGNNPIVVTNNLVFTRNTRIINVGVCEESTGGL